MKYFRIFNHTSAYTEYMKTEDAIVPNLSYCFDDDKMYVTLAHAPVSINEPVITCANNVVTITCATVGATIYYRLNESGSYSAYTNSFEIAVTTVVEAYAVLGVKTSETVKETCEASDFSKIYFTIESLEDNNAIHLRRSYTGNTEYYSLDRGSTWGVITSGSGDKTIATINSGDTIWIKCTTTKWATAYNYYNNFYSTKDIKVYGNAMSLLYGDNFATATTLNGTFALAGLFFGTTSTGGTNSKIVSAKNLVLPATTITEGCYNGMFRNCTAMTESVKVLPATTLYKDCYSSMFENCRSLSEPPEIMATTVNSSSDAASMKAMFAMNRKSNAVTTSMTKGPILRVTNPSLAQNTYESLFDSNASLTEVTILAQGTNLSFSNWLRNATSGGIIKKLSATTLTSGSSGVPSGWSTQKIDEL